MVLVVGVGDGCGGGGSWSVVVVVVVVGGALVGSMFVVVVWWGLGCTQAITTQRSRETETEDRQRR